MTQLSFAIPTLAALAAAIVLAMIVDAIARRVGKWAIACYFFGPAVFVWLGPDLWYQLSMALRAPDEPLGPTGRALSSGLYGIIIPILVYGGICAALAIRRANAQRSRRGTY